MARNAAFFVALLATSLALGGALAHAFELLNKIAMARDEYFIVQRIYAGWDRLGYVLAIQLVGVLAVILLYRSQPRVVAPASVALAALTAAQLVFWTWTFPANQATGNWTQQPAHWERAQWEYSHLAGAAFQTMGMIALVTALWAFHGRCWRPGIDRLGRPISPAKQTPLSAARSMSATRRRCCPRRGCPEPTGSP